MGVGRIQRQHPETSPAGKKFCTAARACEWSRGGRWCGRAPRVPWKFRQGKDSALRRGQLGSAEPGPVLPPALQDTGGCLEGNCGSTSDLPAPDSQVLPVLLLLLAKGQGQVLLGLCAGMNPKQAGPRVLFIDFHTPLPSQVWDQSLPQTPANETKSPPAVFIPSCPSKYLAFSKALCVSCLYVLCWWMRSGLCNFW